MPQLATLTDGATLTPADYDALTCCGHPARVAHATEALPVAGAVCETCLCCVTSPDYGAANVQRCRRHRS
ncbi:hypothetical protein ACWGB8_01885 [Kitasatospora sp. NPDC054939]